MSDYSDSNEFKEWAEHVMENMLPKLKDSDLNASLIPTDGEGDPKFWVELGASIMMDKPIIAIVQPGQILPRKLRMVTDEIVVCDMNDPEQVAALAQKIQEVMKR
jgi:hypothetical protein